jgi:lysophospholipase L1-like esterase
MVKKFKINYIVLVGITLAIGMTFGVLFQEYYGVGNVLDAIGLSFLKNSLEPSSPELSNYYYRITSYHQRMDGNIPKGAILFIGDSITQGLAVTAVADKGINFGIGSDTTLGVLERIHHYDSIKRCQAVVLAIVVNDLRRRENDEILLNYKSILSFIPDDIPVIFSAVLPIDQRIKKDRDNWNNRIASLNESAKEICDSAVNCIFIDSGDKLVDETGNLNSSFHIGDGVHLSTPGYEIWIEDMKNALSGSPSANLEIVLCDFAHPYLGFIRQNNSDVGGKQIQIPNFVTWDGLPVYQR